MADVSNGSGRRKSRLPLLVMLLVALLTVGAVGYAATRGGSDEPADSSAAATTTSATATTTAESTTTQESTTEESTTTAESSTSESTTTSATSSATSTSRTTTTATTTELASLQATGDSRPKTGEAQIDGRTYRDSLSSPIGGCDTNGSFTYDLGGDFSSFSATVGTTEDTDDRSVVRFEVYTDDELTYSSGNLNHGETADIDISVENAQSLRLGFLFIDGDLSRCSNAGEVVWGDPTLTE